MTAAEIDISISNRIYMTDPMVLDTLDRDFATRIDHTLTIDTFWPLATELSLAIWGKNFLLAPPPGPKTRWQAILEDVYNDDLSDLPDYFEDWQHLVSAGIVGSEQQQRFQFTFATSGDDDQGANYAILFDRDGNRLS